MTQNKKQIPALFAVPFSFFFLLSSCSPPPTSSTPVVTLTINEKNFIRNKMFFLDTAYKSFYCKMRPSVPAVKAEKLQVWLSNDRIRGLASANVDTNGNVYRFFGLAHRACKLLKMGRDYALVGGGVIRFDSVTVVTNYDWIGLHLETEDSAIIPSKGVYFDTLDASKVISDTLWTLLPQDYDSTSPAFPLMWRNVYSLLLGFDLATFKLRVTCYPPNTTVERVSESTPSQPNGYTRS